MNNTDTLVRAAKRAIELVLLKGRDPMVVPARVARVARGDHPNNVQLVGAGGTSCRRIWTCHLCGRTVATCSARWPTTKRAADAVERHDAAHRLEWATWFWLIDGVGQTPATMPLETLDLLARWVARSVKRRC